MYALHDLAAFVAVADGGSIRQAATELGRTQPAITQAIQRLEQAVGFPLLDRSTYRSTLTERGALFLKRARATVRQGKDLKAYAGVLSRGNEARLRIAIHGSLPPEAWMHLFESIPEQFPDTVIELRSGEGNAPLRQLMNDEADLAILISSPLDNLAMEVNRQPLGEIEFVNVVQSQRLARPVEEALVTMPQILVADFDDPDTMFGVAQGHRFWRVSDHRTKVAAIVAGMGWGTVPSWLVNSMLADETLHSIAYRSIGALSRHPFYIYHRRQVPLGPVASYIWGRSELSMQLHQTTVCV